MKLVLDDDPFFGTADRSAEDLRRQLMRFSTTDAVMEVIDAGYDLGVRSFTCSTHARMVDVATQLRAARYRDLELLPCLPEGHKYAASVAEHGILETIKRFSTGSVMSTLFRSALGAITQDVSELMKLLVDAEMKRFEGLRTPVVFLQNVVTDLVLGMKRHALFAELHEHVKERYQAEAGFVTMNLPALLDALEQAGIVNPIVCADVNPLGFRMSGGRAAYERALGERTLRAYARNITAHGGLTLEQGLSYVAKLPNVHAVVLGARSSAEIIQAQAALARPAGG